LTNLPAGTYQVFVDTKSPMSATVPVDVYISAPGSQADRCGNPIFVPSGTTAIRGNSCAFNNDYDVQNTTNCTDSVGGNSEDVVFAFRLQGQRTLKFDGCFPGTPGFDQVMYIRDVCNNGALAMQRACNDDGDTCSGTGCTGEYRSQLEVTLPAGLYYLFLDGYDDGCGCGMFDVRVTGL
jgi:hypothetical protein